jgi:Nuclear fragile X mental retardation-interacting protein 1 (NUFIP1)/CCCH-type zinc finger
VAGRQRVHPYKKDSPSKDGDESMVSPALLEAAKDVEKWIEERRKNWPGRKKSEQNVQAELDVQNLQSTTQVQVPAQVSVGSEVLSSNTPRPANSAKPCSYFLKGNCRWGKKCKFSHEAVSRTEPVFYKRFEAPTNSSLFKRLVQNDFDKENEMVLDFINHLFETKSL